MGPYATRTHTHTTQNDSNVATSHGALGERCAVRVGLGHDGLGRQPAAVGQRGRDELQHDRKEQDGRAGRLDCLDLRLLRFSNIRIDTFSNIRIVRIQAWRIFEIKICFAFVDNK